MIAGINKDHITGAVVGVGVCAAGYYLYKKNQNKVDEFLKSQGINISTDSYNNYSNMSIEELMEAKETIEDFIAEKELSANEEEVSVEISE